MIRPNWFSLPAHVRGVVLASLLAAATFAVYWQAYSSDFVNYDDNAYVYDNQHVLTGLTWDSVKWAFTTTDTVNWYPLTWLSFQADEAVYRGFSALLGPYPHAAGFHVTNVILHVADTLLLFWVLNRMTRRLERSAFVAALFALHPLHVESVAWVSERKDVLSTLFWMLTMAAYVLYAERPRWWRYLPVVAFFALGLMAKSMLVTLPCVFVLLDFWPLRRLPGIGPAPGFQAAPVSWLRLVAEKAPLLALSLASAAITIYAQQQGGEANPPGHLPLRIGNALMAYASYMGKMLWPANLFLFYPHPYKLDQVYPAGLEAGLLLVVVSLAAIALARKAPYLLIGWLWYLVTLVPVIGVVQVIGGHGMADRYTYVPLIGLFIALTWGVTEGLKRAGVRPWVPAAVGAVVLAGCLVGTWQQVGYWHDSMTLWARTLEMDPRNYTAYTDMGSDLYSKGKYAEAADCFRKAVEYQPDTDETRLNLELAHYDLAMTLATLGQTDEAVAQYAEAVRVNPRYRPAQYDLAWMLVRQGKIKDALPHLQAAVDLNPGDAVEQNNLGRALYLLRQTKEAILHYEAALRIQPDYPDARANLAEAREFLAERGRRRHPTADVFLWRTPAGRGTLLYTCPPPRRARPEDIPPCSPFRIAFIASRPAPWRLPSWRPSPRRVAGRRPPAAGPLGAERRLVGAGHLGRRQGPAGRRPRPGADRPHRRLRPSSPTQADPLASRRPAR